jgi:hypothetical protein
LALYRDKKVVGVFVRFHCRFRVLSIEGILPMKRVRGTHARKKKFEKRWRTMKFSIPRVETVT